MRRLIKIILITFIVLILCIIVFFIKNVLNNNKIEEVTAVETTIQENEKKVYSNEEKTNYRLDKLGIYNREDIEDEWLDELGIHNIKYKDDHIEYAFRIEQFFVKESRRNIIQDSFLGVGFGSLFSDRSLLPVTDNFYKQKEENGWVDGKWENFFPGYEEPEYKSYKNTPYAEIDDFGKEDKEGIIHFYISDKYRDMKYNYKYYLNKDGWLDSMEYLDLEVIKDNTNEIEHKDRKRKMVKNNNDYLRVIYNYLMYKNSAGLNPIEMYAIDNDLKNKLLEMKYSNDITLFRKDFAPRCNTIESDYDKKIAYFYCFNVNDDYYKKYTFKFDYNNNYELSYIEMINKELSTKEDCYKAIKTEDIMY